MKRFFALTLCALLAVGVSVPAAAAPAQLAEFDQAYLDSLAAKEQALGYKLDACALAGIPADYEMVNYNAFKRYSGILRDDRMVKISINGKDCGAMTDLISGERFEGMVTLGPFSPRLIRVG